MDKLAQTQKGGDNSNQIQAGTIIVNNNIGITEERAREIFSSEIAQKMDVLAVEARDTASARMLELFSDLISRVKKCEKDLSSFGDPAFLQNVRIAQDAAAVSERKEDIETLAELLMARMNGKLKRATKTGIRRAMEIVPELEADELMVLTIMLFYTKYKPNNKSGISVEHYLNALDDYFKKILQADLPIGNRWLQHLTILDAVIVEQISSFAPLEEYYGMSANGLVCAGLRVDSQEYLKALTLLQKTKVWSNILVPNELLSGFVRLPLARLDDFSIPVYIQNMHRFVTITVTEDHRESLKQIIDLYSKDPQLDKQVKAEFAKRFLQHGVLKQLKEWLANREGYFELTSVGEALGYVNARRCLPDLPAIELE